MTKKREFYKLLNEGLFNKYCRAAGPIQEVSIVYKKKKDIRILNKRKEFDTMALKAVLLAKWIPFRFVHDIAELLTLLEQNNIHFPENIRSAAELTDYSVEARYPGPFAPVTEKEFKEALKIAETAIKRAEVEIQKTKRA